MPVGSMACAVCGLVLHRCTEISSSGAILEWIHHAEVDHLTVPVPVEEIQANFQCVFCMAHHARWVLPVEQYVVAPGNINDGDWAACDACADLLRGNDWDALISRAHRIFIASSTGMGQAPRVAFEQIYRQLQGHVVGVFALRVSGL